MSAPDRHRGITVLEVVVIVLIVAVMLALLLPALQTSDGGGRRDTCANNMHNLGFALVQWESANGAFPGYANVINNKLASWVVPILPHLERSDLYRNWESLPPSTTPVRQQEESPWARSYISYFVCPSTTDLDSERDCLSYVVNCGSAWTANDFFPPISDNSAWVEDPNSGIFFNHARADFSTQLSNPNPPAEAFDALAGPRVTMQFISLRDGATNTILLTENLQAATWASDPTDTRNKIRNPFQSEFQIRQNTGFVWFITGNKNNADPAPATSLFNPAGTSVNALAKTVTTPVPYAPYPVAGTEPPTGGLAYARPSSNHPGGVNVIFSDAHLRFISEEIDYKVYTQLMTPNGRRAIVAMPSRTARDAGWDYQLRESDY